MNIKHWEKYLTPLDKTELNVYPDFFIHLFKWNQIILPIFQRKYCWTLKQLKRYWYDLLYVALDIGNLGHRKHARSHDNSHTLGKIVTFEQTNNKITIIDGQQRVTTTLIILISIKTALLKIEQHCDKHTKLINEINCILFRCKSLPNNIKYKQGDSLRFIRFLPTYFDRSSFYDVIFDRIPSQNSLQSAHNNNANPIYFAKRFFDKELLKYNDYNKIARICNKLLRKFKYIYVGIPYIEKEKNVRHCIYQWFFERELFVEQGGGDRPGYSQTVCDLFRNYALSFFMNQSMKQQMKIYKLWLKVEKSYHDINELNCYIISLINTKKLKNYDIYRDLVSFIELKLQNYKQDEYKLFMKEFIKNLKYKGKNVECNNKLIIYGYLRRNGTELQGIDHEIIDVINKYMSKEENVKSLTDMELKIDKKLNKKLNIIPSF